MLDLAICINTDADNTPIIETNGGLRLMAPDWPQDSDFRLVAFDPSGLICSVDPEGLAEDVSEALAALDAAAAPISSNAAWHRRLTAYAKGTAPLRE